MNPLRITTEDIVFATAYALETGQSLVQVIVDPPASEDSAPDPDPKLPDFSSEPAEISRLLGAHEQFEAGDFTDAIETLDIQIPSPLDEVLPKIWSARQTPNPPRFGVPTLGWGPFARSPGEDALNYWGDALEYVRSTWVDAGDEEISLTAQDFTRAAEARVMERILVALSGVHVSTMSTESGPRYRYQSSDGFARGMLSLMRRDWLPVGPGVNHE